MRPPSTRSRASQAADARYLGLRPLDRSATKPRKSRGAAALEMTSALQARDFRTAHLDRQGGHAPGVQLLPRQARRPGSAPWHASRLWRLAALASGLLGCRPKAADATQLVIGVQSEPLGGIASSLHVVITRNGSVVDDSS